MRAIAMLDRTYIPGAVRVPGPSTMPVSTIESDAVQHSRWFTVTGSMDTVVALLRANPPSGFAFSSVGHTNATGPSGTIVGFQAPTAQRQPGRGRRVVEPLPGKPATRGGGRLDGQLTLQEGAFAGLPKPARTATSLSQGKLRRTA